MSELKYLVLHCTATPEGKSYTSDDIRRMHMGPFTQPDGKILWNGKTFSKKSELPDIMFYGKNLRQVSGRGWKQVGYSDIIHPNGEVENLVPYDDDGIVQPREITNGALGLNGMSRHVSYIGGIDATGKPKDTRTARQMISLDRYIKEMIRKHPDIKILGHNQVATKACPSFNVPFYLKSIGVDAKNIYMQPSK